MVSRPRENRIAWIILTAYPPRPPHLDGSKPQERAAFLAPEAAALREGLTAPKPAFPPCPV